MNPIPPITLAEHFRIRLSLQLINSNTHNDNDFPLKTGTENILKPTDATDENTSVALLVRSMDKKITQY